MALWGNKDNLNIGGIGTVYVSSWTHDTTNGGYQITGSGTTFTNFAVGDVIRFGDFKGSYYGDAVINKISSNTVAYIASTEGLSNSLGLLGPGFGATTFIVTQAPSYTVGDSGYKEADGLSDTGYTKEVYAVTANNIDATGDLSPGPGAGWVGIQTYTQADGTLRVKSEILVAASGITTGGRPKFPTPLDLA
jgi:hypothetical protein